MSGMVDWKEKGKEVVVAYLRHCSITFTKEMKQIARIFGYLVCGSRIETSGL